MGNNSAFGILAVIGIVAIGVFMFGCNAGLSFVCKFRNQVPTTAAAAVDPLTGLPMTTGAPLTPAQQAQQIAMLQQLQSTTGTGATGGERQTLTAMMEFIVNQLVSDLDKYTYADLGRDTLFNLQAQVLEHDKDTLEQIADYNDMRMQPLQGRALAKYSELLLNTARRYGISLNPAAEASLRAQLFSGSPITGNTTANLALAIS